MTRLPSSLQRWFPSSVLVIVLLGSTAAAQRIGVPWGSLVAGLLSLTGLLLSCMVAVMTLNILLRLSSRCYQEWGYRPAMRSSRELPGSGSAASPSRRRPSRAAKVTQSPSIWGSMGNVVRDITARLGCADDAALNTSRTEQAPVVPPVYDRFAEKVA